MQDQCTQAKRLTVGNQRMINDFVDVLNRRLAEAVSDVNADHGKSDRRLTYVDISEAFAGHEMCRPVGVRWFNHYVREGVLKADRLTNSFHPNTMGQQAMADRVVECYNGGRCGPRVPPKVIGAEYGVNQTILEDYGFRVKVAKYEYVTGGLKVYIDYQNTLDRPNELNCPVDETWPKTIRTQKGKVFKASDNYCLDHETETFIVGPKDTHRSWGVFPLTGRVYGGEKITIDWYGMKTKQWITLWK